MISSMMVDIDVELARAPRLSNKMEGKKEREEKIGGNMCLYVCVC